MKKILTFIALLGFSFSALAAEKAYVSDTLHLDVRSGPSNEYRILTYIASGEHLVILEDLTLTDDRYRKVRTNKGIEGYVLTRFLVDEPVAKEKLIFANREIEQLKGTLVAARKARDEFKAEVGKLKSELGDLSGSNAELEKELDEIKRIAASSIELNVANKELTQSNHDLEVQVQTLSTENAQLRDTRQQTYILYGGGLVIAGILAGLILPALRGKRSSSWA